VSSEDWAQIKHAFTAALNLPPGERDAFVAAACDHRTEMIAAVGELLRAHGDASQSFLGPESLFIAARWLFQEGDRVAGRFKVVRRIARGSMGEVYQVFDERLRLPIALKAIRPDLVEDAETVERFRREVLVTRDIAHEGLCRVFDLVEHTIDDHPTMPAGTVVPCLTMQLLEGETLEDWLASRRPLAAEDALPLLEQIAKALQTLHDAGVVHRDLKPSNVMLVPREGGVRAVLTDFGLAKAIEPAVFETQAHVHGGAPFFMAPELFGGQRPSVASDLYAFGLLVDEMITTTRSFAADSLHGLLIEKLHGSPEPPSRRGSKAPRHWDRVIQCCLARDPRDRFRRVEDVLAALRVSSGWTRWRGTVRWIKSTYLPRRWRVARYVTAAAVILSAFLALAARGVPVVSVAISPFENITGDPRLKYLAAGSASELGRRLSRVPNVRVFAPSDFGTTSSSAQRATYALHGHVQRVGALLRVTVTLTDVATGELVWSSNFDRKQEDALNLQEELAAAAVAELTRPARHDGVWAWMSPFVVWAARSAQLPSTGTTNPAAFDDYLRGKMLFEERTRESVLEAARFLRSATERDQNFAAAWAALADLASAQIEVQYASPDELIRQADANVSEAIRLDRNLPEAQLSLALVRQLQWRWDEAGEAYRRAIALNPASPRALRWYGGLLLQFGKFGDAFPLYEKAISLDPYDFASQSAYGHALLTAGKTREAAVVLEQLLARKDFFNAHVLLGQAYADLQRSEPDRRDYYFQNALKEAAAVRSKETAVRATPDGPPVASPWADLISALAWIYHGDPDTADAFVRHLTAGHDARGVSAGFLARVHAAQGHKPEALNYLLEAEQDHDRELYYVNVSPVYAEIRQEPQFRALVKRLQLSR
jgi:TolB-like protein